MCAHTHAYCANIKRNGSIQYSIFFIFSVLFLIFVMEMRSYWAVWVYGIRRYCSGHSIFCHEHLHDDVSWNVMFFFFAWQSIMVQQRRRISRKCHAQKSNVRMFSPRILRWQTLEWWAYRLFPVVTAVEQAHSNMTANGLQAIIRHVRAHMHAHMLGTASIQTLLQQQHFWFVNWFSCSM